jgi:uncharacterized PurR-regulated membrane protein YhhQ (DUF165 family)
MRFPREPAAAGFTLLCLLGMLAILVMLAIEWGRLRRGEAPLGARVFRWRLISGLVWLWMLGSFAYATWFLWPDPNDKVMARRFLTVIVNAGMLMLLALVLLIADVIVVLRERRRQQQHLAQQLSAILDEAQRKKN